MGYITGLAPDVLVDVEDPFKMAVEISSYVKKELAELEKATAWIPVTERLPEEDVEVWCAYKSNVFTAYFKDGSWWVEINDEDECEINVTHWMPLPQPPEEAK
jgi:hypothetical protein